MAPTRPPPARLPRRGPAAGLPRPTAPASFPGMTATMPTVTSLQLSIAQFSPRKGDYPANLRRLGGIFGQLDALPERPRVLHLPETALTGYLVEGGVQSLAVTAGALARDLDAAYRAVAPGRPPLDVVVGFYERWRHTLHNSALYARLGEGDAARVLHVHRKNFLPTYGMFDEERFVERGVELRAFDTAHGRAGILVCEDAWHSLTGTVLALDGAEIVYVCAAAPGRGVRPAAGHPMGPGNVARWERLMRDIAEEHGVFVSLANLVGSEAGKLFSGSSMVVAPSGEVILRAPAWDESLATVALDLRDLGRARAATPLLADLRVQLPHLQREMNANGARPPVPFDDGDADPSADRTAAPPSAGADRMPATDGETGGRADGNRADGNRADDSPRADGPRAAGAMAGGALPVLDAAHGHPAAPPLEIDPELVTAWLVRFLRDELAQRGFGRAIVGISGGVDSAVTAALAARALGSGNVIGVRMPYRTGSPASLEHGQLVIDALGIEGRTVDISPAVDGYLAQVTDTDATRRGNVMARMRMITLFDLSSACAALPLGTGNKTERLFGYFTWHADDSPPVNPLGDLYKTQVWALARHLGLPSAVIDKPASADLVPGQTDEGDFGISYDRADVLLHSLLSGYSAAELVERGHPEREVDIVNRRLEGTHWKRRLPTVAVLSATAIGESYLRPVDY